MKKCLLLVVLFFLSSSVFSSEVRCYSDGKLFYYKKVKDLFIGDGFVINRDAKYDEVIIADCVIRYKKRLHLRK